MIRENIILFDSFAESVAGAKEMAGSLNLGTSFQTPAGFLENAWGLWGDDRAFVSAVQRKALVYQLLERQETFSATVGSVDALARFFERVSGFSAELPHKGLGPEEQAVLGLLEEYELRLLSLRLVEPGLAARELSSVMSKTAIDSSRVFDLMPAVRSLVRSLGNEAPLSGEASAGIAQPQPGCTVSFAFPAGSTAVCASVRDCVLGVLDDASEAQPCVVAVCSPEPLSIYDALSAELCSHGAHVSLECSVSFRETLFGRAVFAYRAFAEGTPSWRRAASDFSASVYSGASPYDAQALDALIRGDRLISHEDVRTQLLARAPHQPLFSCLIDHGDASALTRLAAAADESFASGSLRGSIERAAVTFFSQLVEQVLAAGSPVGHAIEFAQSSSFKVSLCSAEPLDGGIASCDRLVRFVDYAVMSTFAPASFDAVVVGDVSDAGFPAKERGGSLDLLAEKMGVQPAPSPYARQRLVFSHAVRASRSRFVCVMPLVNESFEEAYPAFFLDEFIDSLSAPGDLLEMGAVKIPSSLIDVALSRSEGDLIACMGRTYAQTISVRAVPRAARGYLGSLSLLDHMRTVQEGSTRVAVLSPSGIESYLRCPYRWFVEGRIRLNRLDEAFGPLEQGSFVHSVFAAFYETLAARGIAELGLAEDDDVDNVFNGVFDALVAQQASLDRGRYVAATPSEALDIESLRTLLRDSVERQRRLPPEFRVYAHEFVISCEDEVDYAGVRLNGRADRIDVCDESKRYVVLDYKGNVSGHAAGFPEDADAESFPLPQKVQALIYAQALHGQFDGYACAGAMYLSYRAKHANEVLIGSFDESAFDVAGLTKKASSVCMNFDSYLDLVEGKIKEKLTKMLSGDISVAPSSRKACDYCPVESCEGRLK